MNRGFWIVLIYAQLSLAAIFGLDDRRSIDALPAEHQLKKLSDATAIAVLSGLTQENDESVLIQVDPLEGYICPTEKFANDSSLGYACTGFLIAPDLLLTAGHCMVNTGEIRNETENYCRAFSWLFGYSSQLLKNPSQIEANKQKLYSCKEIIYAVRDEKMPFRDYAIVKLDRPVHGVEPLAMAETNELREPLSMIGYPLGTPAKLSHSARILLNNPERESFVTSLDAFAGNSGSPVFDAQMKVVGILVAGTPSLNLVDDTQNSCKVYNKCDETGLECLLPDRDSSVFKEFQRIGSDVQRIDSIKEFLKNNYR